MFRLANGPGGCQLRDASSEAFAGASVPSCSLSVQRREVHLGDRLVATSPSQVASQWEAPRPSKKRHDCLSVTAQQQQQRDADEERNRRRSTNRRSTVLSDDDIWNGGEVDQVDLDNVQVNIFVERVHHRGLLPCMCVPERVRGGRRSLECKRADAMHQPGRINPGSRGGGAALTQHESS